MQVLTFQIIRAIKRPPNQKRERTTGNKRLKGHGSGHTVHSVTDIFIDSVMAPEMICQKWTLARLI